MNKRDVLATAAIALAFAAVAATPAAAGELNILTWEGYADPSFIKAFEDHSGCKVTATYVGSNDDFVPKLAAGGGVYDMISPSIDTQPVTVAAGYIDPIDVSKIEGFDQVYELFRTSPGVVIDGKVWGVPWTWGSIPFMYRTDKISEEPTSIAALWDPKYAGKVSLWDDKSALYVAARLNGDTNIYNLSDEQLEKAKAKLIEQKPLIRKYWGTAGELVNLFASGEVWISNTWGGFQSNELMKQGIPVKEFIPKENAEGWMDSWQIVKGTPNIDCVYKWLNYSLTPGAQCGVANVTGYSASNPVAAKSCMSEEQFVSLHQDDANYINSLILWETPDRLEVYTNTWNAVKAAQ
ncbi:MAG TPA: ABC transporter substrate-binding protein [Alphaproteobacteria bacterium]|nr:ABC transporter substrate-binding protein [Alphaproteobacteria bacterium]